MEPRHFCHAPGVTAVDESTGQILIAGTEDTFADWSVTAYLRELGYAVTIAATGQQALQKLRGKAFDLLLLAVNLPDMDGLHLLEGLHFAQGLHRPPVLILTTERDIVLAEQCLAHGADDLLRSPVKQVVFKKRLENILRTARLQAALSACQQDNAIAQKLAKDLTQVILPIGIALSKIKNFDRLLEKILRETKGVCNADGGTLYLREGELLKFAILLNDSLQIEINDEDSDSFPSPLRLWDEATGAPNHKHVATASALLGISIHVPDIYQVRNFDFSEIKAFDQKYGYHSISSLTIPLKNHDGDVFGVLQLINPKDPQTGDIIPFDAYMQQVAEALASLVALVLSYQDLLERQKEFLRVEDELNIGRQIQTSFLPETIPQPPGWEIVARLRPARTISGDFYDVFALEKQQHIGIVIADVCDKGVGAALFMVLIRTLIRAFAEYSLDGQTPLRSVVDFTNDYILRNHYQTNMFATLFIGMLDPATGMLRYVNSGHPAPLLLNAEGVKSHLSPTGPVIGAFPHIAFEVHQVHLKPEDMLFAFTDGITEARNANGKIFTSQRLLTCVNHAGRLTSGAALLDHVEETVQQYMAEAVQFDDVTMLTIRRNAYPYAQERSAQPFDLGDYGFRTVYFNRSVS
ncbi:SpoIIE family protein phosphatase [candidate division KSB3 bacterium]|uniref:SpoIIE family protein phosphatase n=1 Tax=candidate division KSB3 bacterium TaxID=2044937 RepID=A0A9D5JSD1_9BACT|nr:SpoIIE family protein phosphatase [candidate division KSB3 bacterium]MBD3323134.1 SpoIIE family protein phosphatase [candidate division KSB3 bacterium]